MNFLRKSIFGFFLSSLTEKWHWHLKDQDLFLEKKKKLSQQITYTQGNM